MKLEKLEALITRLLELHQAHPTVQAEQVTVEPPELELHRYVKHVYVNRFYIEVLGGGVKLSFGNGSGEQATFNKEGVFLNLENATELVRDIRKWLIEAGHPDPFPEIIAREPVKFDANTGIFNITVNEGGSGGASYSTGSGGGAGQIFTGRTAEEAQAVKEKWNAARETVIKAQVDDWLERRPEWRVARIETEGRKPFTVVISLNGGFEVSGEGETEAQATWAAILTVSPDASIE